jgi:hypothetical protein
VSVFVHSEAADMEEAKNNQGCRSAAIKLFIGLLVFASLNAVAISLMWVLSADDRENNSHINQDIFPAFRSIESYCAAEEYPNETVRCAKARSLQRECLKQEHDCGAREYYDALSDYGFDLPSLYEPGYVPK